MLNKRRILTIISLAVAGILLVSSPFMFEAWKKKRTFDRAFDDLAHALELRDFETVYEMGSAEFKSVATQRTLQLQFDNLNREFGNLVSVERGTTVVQGTGTPVTWVGVTKTRVILQRGTITLVYELHLDDGVWRLHGIHRE